MADVPVLQLQQLHKHYAVGERQVRALDGVDVTIKAGEQVAILGPSGSGKSTLLGLIAGLDRPTSGRVLVEGQDLAELDEDALALLRAQRLGFVFQNFRLLSQCTALENVTMPLELAGVVWPEARQRAEHQLRRVGLAERMQHLPSRLSGGEQQRVAIARALVIEPHLLVADEPTGNLDSHTGTSITDLLFDLSEGGACTLILVTHEAELARRAGRHIHLRDGRVQSDGVDS